MSFAVRHSRGVVLHATSPKASPVHCYGRSAAYRRLYTLLRDAGANISTRDSHRIGACLISRQPLPAAPLRSRITSSSSLRPFSVRTSLFADQQKPEDIKDSPRQEKAESQGQEEQSEDSTQSGGRKSKEENSKKDEAAPPPPHGDKTPWQVFTETLRSEFKASKEWNEGTKALSASAHQFSESESVKRARAAYSAASDAASSGTSSVLKNAGKAVGQSAAWTWDTSVVKGVRKGANAVGKGIDSATKPVRETAAFKSIKDVIDDGSSSRYGGWVEKEERRKARELRELEEVKSGKRRMEKIEEDPK